MVSCFGKPEGASNRLVEEGGRGVSGERVGVFEVNCEWGCGELGEEVKLNAVLTQSRGVSFRYGAQYYGKDKNPILALF